MKSMLSTQRVHDAFNSLKLEPILLQSLNRYRRRQHTPPLPDELILQIFQMIADEVLSLPNSYAYNLVAAEVSSFFKVASLVCRKWYRLAGSFMSPMVISTGALFKARPHKPMFRRLLRCESLIVDDYGMHSEKPPYYGLAKRQVPPCVLTCATNITALRVELSFFSHPGLQIFLQTIAGHAKRLHLYARGCAPPLDYLSMDLHRNNNLKELTLDDVRLVYFQDHIDKPLLCENVLLEDVEVLGDVDVATVFPNARRIIVYQAKLPSMIDNWQLLSLSKPSRKLVHLDILCTSLYPFGDKHQNEELGILRSPNLRSLRIDIRKECRASYEPPAPRLDAPVLPGYNMPNLTSLIITVIPAENWAFDLLTVCQRLKDSLFCPRLASLPLLRIPPWTRAMERYLEEYLDENSINRITETLASLQARGLALQSEDFKSTIWQFARQSLMNTNCVTQSENT